jgi:hypothetical protein
LLKPSADQGVVDGRELIMKLLGITEWVCLLLLLTSIGLMAAASEVEGLRGYLFCFCGSFLCFAMVVWFTVQRAINAKWDRPSKREPRR